MIQHTNLLTDILWSSHEIDVSKYDSTFLHTAFERRRFELQLDTQKKYHVFIEQNKEEAVYFEHSLHNSYSEFFRNKLTFALLEKIILPSLTLQKKEIRIWCAACASGEEVYSLAILMEEMKKLTSSALNYHIFATDQCASQIQNALKGQYSLSSLGNITLSRSLHWFTKQEDSYTIDSALRKNIDFSIFNLFDESSRVPSASIFGNFDLVFCANLLFYYKPKYRNMILHKVSQSLAPHGYLITGETERIIVSKTSFNETFPQSAIFQLEINK